MYITFPLILLTLLKKRINDYKEKREKAKGTNLYTLKGDNTRPTSDRAKEALFNILGMDVVDSCFLDLFAGSGAIGLEAASRGAKTAILIDKSKEAVKIIKRNAEKTHLENNVSIYQAEAIEALKTIVKEKQDYIFLDPPYKSDLLFKSINTILEQNILVKGGIIIAETDEPEVFKNQIKDIEIEIIDERKYGRNQFLFLKRLSD